MKRLYQFLPTLLMVTSLYVCLLVCRDEATPWKWVALYWAILTAKNLLEMMMGGK